MDRLDAVLGAENWQDRYEFHGVRTICYLSIRIEDEWITKGDGAGDSDVEAEKGAISDALKRAAVKWGIGRYLYDLSSPWVPCETYEKGGKAYFSKWKDDPWNYVKGMPVKPQQPKQENTPLVPSADYLAIEKSMRGNANPDDLRAWWKDDECKTWRAKLTMPELEKLRAEFAAFGSNLAAQQDATQTPFDDETTRINDELRKSPVSAG
jgi:hypothetical protein